MDPLKLYEISEEYIAYLRSFGRLVFSAKEEDRIHTRKYLGIVHTINNYDYYIPLSSPKNTDYQIINGKRKIRRSIISIIRITAPSDSGEPELKGTLKLSNMIPVPPCELSMYDIENEPDLSYKSLIYKELIFIRKNRNKIIQYANVLYKQKKNLTSLTGYLNNTVYFSLLEQKRDDFIMQKESINKE